MVTEALLEANGVRHRYLCLASGPLVTLLQGFPDIAEGVDPVMEELAAHGYRAVAPNLRCYPPTGPASDGDYSLVAGARDVAQRERSAETAAAIVHFLGRFASNG